jgi:hypothetical protein
VNIAQRSDLALFIGDLSQSEKLSEIKAPLGKASLFEQDKTLKALRFC